MAIKGLQEAQAANNRQIAATKRSRTLGRAVLYAMTKLHRYAVAITHVWVYKGGGLRASHRMKLERGGLCGRIYIDPSAVNPRGQKPSIYGPIEEARGGSHAFYYRAVSENDADLAGSIGRMFAGDFS